MYVLCTCHHDYDMYNLDSQIPIDIEKLGLTGVYIICLYFALKHRLLGVSMCNNNNNSDNNNSNNNNN